jgi:hypothetical protein
LQSYIQDRVFYAAELKDRIISAAKLKARVIPAAELKEGCFLLQTYKYGRFCCRAKGRAFFSSATELTNRISAKGQGLFCYEQNNSNFFTETSLYFYSAQRQAQRVKGPESSLL